MATIKQKRAAKIKLENPHKPMRQVMKEAGYSQESADYPSRNLTETKGWQELMKEYLPDDLLAKKHKEFLETPRIVTKYSRGEVVDEYEETSPQAVKALDMAYKLKGHYKDVNINQALIVNLSPSVAKKYAIESQPRSDNK